MVAARKLSDLDAGQELVLRPSQLAAVSPKPTHPKEILIDRAVGTAAIAPKSNNCGPVLVLRDKSAD
jgi:hypothetical protein